MVMVGTSSMMLVALVVFILAAPLRQAAATCELCFDGEAITKPDYVLGLTEPVRIETCEDLVNLLAFIQEDDALCSSARAVGTLCGCPNRPPNACTICGEKNMTRPLQNLEGLVDLGDVDYFGLSPTCALLDSGIHVIGKDDQGCSTLPMDELQLYCGCSSGEEENSPSTTCTLCPGGEIVPVDPQDIFQLMLLNSNGDRVSCSDARQQVPNLESGSVLCDDFQRGSTKCGCPVPENACEVCPDGTTVDPTKSSAQIEALFGIRQGCNTFIHQVRRFGRDSVECQSIDESIIEACCSTSEVEFVPCTLCPGGESVLYPDKMIVGMDGFGFDYLEPRCGVLDAAVKVVDENDVSCFSARTLAKVCGCAVSETSCSMCGAAGDTISNPNGEYQWAFGNIQESFPELHENIDIEERFRCEMADSFLSLVYEKGDDFCYFNQLIRGTACGCDGPENTKVIALVWAQRCSGLLSLLGSLLIIVFVLTKKAQNRWNTYNQLVLSISVFDAFSSVSYIFGTALTPAYLGLYGSIGTDGTCVFQGWLFQMGMTSVYYNVALCFYFLVVVKFNWTDRKFKKVRKWVHFGILAVGITMSLAIIPFVTAGWRWCYVNKPPYYESWLPGVFFFILPIGICIIGMTVLMIFFVKYVRQVESKSNRRKLSGTGPNRRSLANRTFWQSVYFLAVFYMVWPIQFVAFVIPLVEENYWIYLLAALLGPLQGFLNALVVFSRDRKALGIRAFSMCGVCSAAKKMSSFFTHNASDQSRNNRFISWFDRIKSSQINLPSAESEEQGASGSNGGRNQPAAFSFHVNNRANADSRLSPEKNVSCQKTDSQATADHSACLKEATRPVDVEVEEYPALPKDQDHVGSLMANEIVENQPPGVDAQHRASQGDVDIDTSIGLDAIFSGENKLKRQVQNSAFHESDAILELAMNAGLLDDVDYALYQDSIHRLA